MTPPTLHEFAGIFMLALAAAVLIAHPSGESYARQAPVEASAPLTPETIPIDGIQDTMLASTVQQR